MKRKRYVIRLHKSIRGQVDALARQDGYLTPTYISIILEKELETATVPYEFRDEEGIFQLKAGGMEKGEIASADKQISLYLSDFAYDRVGEIARWRKENVNKKIGPAYIIRDLIYRWMTEQQ